MRVLEILDKPPTGGGIARHVAELSTLLRELGHSVTVLRLGDPAGQVTLAPGELCLPRSFGPLQGMRLIGALKAHLRRTHPDVVHLHAGFTAMSPVLVRQLRRRYPVVGTLHDVRPFCYIGSRRYRNTTQMCPWKVGPGCVSRGCYRPASAASTLAMLRQICVKSWLLKEWRALAELVVPSSFLRQLAIDHGFVASRVHLIPHFTAAAHPQPIGLPFPGRPLILYIGALQESKGVLLLAELFRLLTDLRWEAVVVGEGPARAVLARAFDEGALAGRVTLRGWLEPKALEEHLARARVLIFPSLAAEGFGLVGIEALARGIPVAGFSAGGATEWLRNGETGLAVPVGDVQGLAGAVRRLLLDETLARQLGATGRRQAEERFAAYPRVAQLCSVFDRVLAARDNRRPVQ